MKIMVNTCCCTCIGSAFNQFSKIWIELPFCNNCLKTRLCLDTNKHKMLYASNGRQHAYAYVAFRKNINDEEMVIFQMKKGGIDHARGYRWSPQFGFPGGEIESECSPWNEAKREIYEETCGEIDISNMNISKCLYINDVGIIFIFVINYEDFHWTDKFDDNECASIDYLRDIEANKYLLHMEINPSHAFISFNALREIWKRGKVLAKYNSDIPIVPKKIIGGIDILYGKKLTSESQ